jgi:hypothetical protein
MADFLIHSLIQGGSIILQGVKKVPGPPAISTATLLPDNSVTADSAAHSANKNSD